MQKETCCTVDLLATFNLFDKSPAFLNFSSPQLVRWSAYCMQKKRMQKDTRLLLVLHLESLFRYSKTYWSEKKDQWNFCSLNDVGHCQTKRERLTCTAWPRTMNTPKTTQNHKPWDALTKTIVRSWTFLTVQPRYIVACRFKTPTSIHITDFKKSPYPSQPPTPSALRNQNTTLLRTNTSHL